MGFYECPPPSIKQIDVTADDPDGDERSPFGGARITPVQGALTQDGRL
jgi:hypothetical protein